MRCDEAINRRGNKVRVKAQFCYFPRYNINFVRYKGDNPIYCREPSHYFWYYDEDEVYHFEDDRIPRKVIFTCRARSPLDAIKQFAVKFDTLKN